MKISFIIPAYNEENYIGDCLDSLVKEIDRTGPSVVSEIIVVDNGSTDRTRLIAESSPGVRVVDEKVKSSGNARQRGFLNAQGEIVAFLDADTHIPSGWIQTMLDSFSKDSKVVAVSGPYVYFDLSPFWKAISLPYEIIVGTAAHFLTGHCVAGGNFAIQRKALSAIGGFDTSLVRYGSDLDAARRLQKIGKVAFNKDLRVEASARRFNHRGVFVTTFIYAMNFFAMALLKRPAKFAFRDIR